MTPDKPTAREIGGRVLSDALSWSDVGGRSLMKLVEEALERAGYRLAGPGETVVPREPTIDMQIAGQEEWAVGRRGAVEDCEEATAIYRAMLAAAEEGK